MENSFRGKVLSGLVWRYAERCGSQGVQFIVSIILARLLTPEDYGVIGLITVFLSLCNLFIGSGFGNSLIQKKDATSCDYSSVFYFNIGMSILLYIVMFFAAPYIAMFYEQEILVSVLRILSLGLILGGVNAVQQAYVSKTMQFKRFFFSTLGGTIVSAFVGIYIAYNGGGVWALVAQSLTNQALNTVILWMTVKWRPTLEFSAFRMKTMFSFGWKMLVSSVIDVLYNNIYSLIIGKVYSAQDLGIYNRGKTFPVMIVENANNSIQSVIFPALAAKQDNPEQVKGMVRRAIKTSTFVVLPAMAGLAAVAVPLIEILLTEKWLPSVPFLRFSCFIYAFWPIHTANLQAINALGRSDIYLKLEIIKKVVGIGILCITVPRGLYAMMIGSCVSAIFSSLINAFPNKKLLDYSYLEQIKDIGPSALFSVIMAGITWSITLLHINMYCTLIIQIVTGIVIYIGLSYAFKLESFSYLLNMLKLGKEKMLHKSYK